MKRESNVPGSARRVTGRREPRRRCCCLAPPAAWQPPASLVDYNTWVRSNRMGHANDILLHFGSIMLSVDFAPLLQPYNVSREWNQTINTATKHFFTLRIRFALGSSLILLERLRLLRNVRSFVGVSPSTSFLHPTATISTAREDCKPT